MWIGIAAERDDDPDEVKQLRDAERARREAIFAISWRRLLVAVGVMGPGLQTLSDAERERRIRQMVTAADKLHTARPYSRRERRALQRLRRLARLASANDIAAVRARVARTTRDVAKIAGCSPTTAWRAIHSVKQTSAAVSPNENLRFEHGPDAEADTLLQA